MRRSRRTRPAAAGRQALLSQRGFTLIEVMCATGILAVSFLAMAGVHAVSSKAQTLGKSQGLATYVANQQLELMRRSTFANVVSSTSNATADGVQFTVTRTVTAIGSNKRVEVVSAWTDRFGPQTVRLVTMVSQVTNP